MEIIRGTKDFYIEGPCAVTIGKFDGIHMGHRKLLSAIAIKRQLGFKICVFSFDPAPEIFFGKEDKCLTTSAEKERLFEKLGVDVLVEYPFDRETADMEPEKFVEEILVDRMNARFIAAGDDLSFGRGGKGDSALLSKLQDDYGYGIEIIEKVKINGETVSSTLVRRAVKEGNMELVRELLGGPYQVLGQIVQGAQIGRTIGLPTINQTPEDNKLLPPFGVYYSETEIEGAVYKGITNIGVKPTVTDERKITVETFLYNFNQDVYGNEATVRLFKFARPERKFDSLEELKAQIKSDCENGMNFESFH